MIVVGEIIDLMVFLFGLGLGVLFMFREEWSKATFYLAIAILAKLSLEL